MTEPLYVGSAGELPAGHVWKRHARTGFYTVYRCRSAGCRAEMRVLRKRSKLARS